MWKQFLRKLPPRKSSKSEKPPNNSSSPAAASTAATTAISNGPYASFAGVASSDWAWLFVAKIDLCCSLPPSSEFSFSKPDTRRQTLSELAEFSGSVATSSFRFTEPMIDASCRLFASDLFRPFPPSRRGVETEDENDPVFDPAWPDLQPVYDLLLNLVSSPALDAKLAKSYFDRNFLSRLLELFDSEDPRERDCLKSVLHRIYGKFMPHRSFIRKSVSNVFYRFVFETDKHSGIAELLEVFGSVITGFALPLKEEHKLFLWKTLIPLHKPKSAGVYMQQLTYCVVQFIEKEPALASTVIMGMLKYWPVTNSQKEVMFLGELEEVLESTNMVEFQKCMVPLFRRIACSLNSSHFQVAERALFLWNNDHFISLIAENRQAILPLIIPALERNTRNHWNKAVVNVTSNVKKTFSDMDEELFTSCQNKFIKEEEARPAMEEKRKIVWEHLENAAFQPVTRNTSFLTTPVISSPIAAATIA